MTELKKLFGEVEKIYVVLCETAESFKRSLSPEDSQKVAETNEKIDLVIQQFEMSKSSLPSLEKISKQQRMKLLMIFKPLPTRILYQQDHTTRVVADAPIDCLIMMTYHLRKRYWW